MKLIRRMKNNVSKSFLFLAITFFLATPAMSLAQIPNLGTSQGLTISPFLLERQLEKGQTLEDSIDVSNTTNNTLPIDIIVKDFLPTGDNGQEIFLDAGQGDPTYSLASWVTIKNSPKLVLGPHEHTNVDFSITPPMNAEDGGHYGAILFSFKGATVNGSAVQVTQQLGAVLLAKLGKVTEDGTIAQFSPNHSFYEYPPVDFITRFKNTGNVHVQPRGGISVYNMFGKQIANVQVNPNAFNTLPNSERNYPAQWKDTFGFGRYTAVERLTYGDSGVMVNASTSFWVIPWRLIIGVGILLFILLVILRTLLRRYNASVIRKAYEMQQKKKK